MVKVQSSIKMKNMILYQDLRQKFKIYALQEHRATEAHGCIWLVVWLIELRLVEYRIRR